MRVRQRTPRSTLAGRFVRGRRLDDNPLRRASDRAETLVLIVLAAVFLVCAPLAAPASAGWAHAMAQRTELAQASRSQVTAVVVTTPTRPVLSYGGYVSTAKVRWTAPDGTAVTRRVQVRAGTEVGDSLNVWTTPDGQLTVQPLNSSQVASLTALGAAGGVAALAAVLALASALARWLLNRRRLAGWDADWQATEPRWTTRA
jgi:hypothetical protein